MEKMYKYNQRSADNLSECHPVLQEIFNDVIHWINLGIFCGRRSLKEQQQMMDEGKSSLKDARNGRHVCGKEAGRNDEEFSRAVDVYWFDEFKGKVCWSPAVYRVIGPMIVQYAKLKGYNLRWGGDWDQDGDMKDQKFFDLVHFEYND